MPVEVYGKFNRFHMVTMTGACIENVRAQVSLHVGLTLLLIHMRIANCICPFKQGGESRGMIDRVHGI